MTLPLEWGSIRAWIGFDTNVLVRYIVQDDPEQAAAVSRLIEGRCTAESPGYVSVPVLVELVWVLTTAYRHEKAVVIPVMRQILRTAESRSRIATPFWLHCASSNPAPPTSRTV